MRVRVCEAAGCVRRVREDTDMCGRMREDEGGAAEVISELTAATQAAEWAAPRFPGEMTLTSGGVQHTIKKRKVHRFRILSWNCLESVRF